MRKEQEWRGKETPEGRRKEGKTGRVKVSVQGLQSWRRQSQLHLAPKLKTFRAARTYEVQRPQPRKDGREPDPQIGGEEPPDLDRQAVSSRTREPVRERVEILLPVRHRRQSDVLARSGVGTRGRSRCRIRRDRLASSGRQSCRARGRLWHVADHGRQDAGGDGDLVRDIDKLRGGTASLADKRLGRAGARERTTIEVMIKFTGRSSGPPGIIMMIPRVL